MLLLLLASTAWGIDTDGDGLEDADEVLASLPPLVADSDGDGLYDHLDADMDGDGVVNVDECRSGGVSGLALDNGGFEEPAYSGTGYDLLNESSVPGWETSAPDHLIELWYGGFIKPAYEGQQIVELNANYASTLYQDVTTTYGDTYIYAFSHRGRAGTDTMRFSLSGIEVRTVSDGPGAWGRYGGVVTIVDAMTSFQFEAVASSCGASCGNLLDAISFTPACDLDSDGDGIPDALDTDSDNDGVLDSVDVCPGADDAVEDPDGDLLCGSSDACPLDAWNDADADGACGDVDLCAGFDDAIDLDGDGTPDGCDSDRDGDGYDESVDCDEDNPAVGAASTYYPDLDGDGYGVTASAFTTCAPGVVFVLSDGDCDDTRTDVNPGAYEYCDTAGADEDCDGLAEDADPDVLGGSVWHLDFDGDGHGSALTSDATTACVAPLGYITSSDDCEDASATALPGGTESCDGLDNDCDGTTDETTDCFDDDGDGITEVAGDCDDTTPAIGPTVAEVEDGIDQDCDGFVDDGTDAFDDDGDGLTEHDGDCDDGDASVGTATAWYDDRDADGHGAMLYAISCDPPAGTSALADDCDDGDDDIHPGAVEDCDEEEDLNCDGSFGWADADGDRWAACLECDDGSPTTHPGAVEVCDGFDNDCNGATDDGAANASTWYADLDGDGVGTDPVEVSCTGGAGLAAVSDDCDDNDPSRAEDCSTDTGVDTGSTDTATDTGVDTGPTDTGVDTDTDAPVCEPPQYGGGWSCSTTGSTPLGLLAWAALALRRRKRA